MGNARVVQKSFISIPLLISVVSAYLSCQLPPTDTRASAAPNVCCHHAAAPCTKEIPKSERYIWKYRTSTQSHSHADDHPPLLYMREGHQLVASFPIFNRFFQPTALC